MDKKTPQHTVETLSDILSFYRKKHKENEKKAEESQTCYADDYIVKLVKTTEHLGDYIKEHPDKASDVLKCASLIVAEGYPSSYIDGPYDKSAYPDAAHDAGTINNLSEVDLSSHLRTLLIDIAKADPSLMQSACEVATKIKDCNEKTYFCDYPCQEAIFENNQKRNCINWMKREINRQAKGNTSKDETPPVYLGDYLLPFESIYLKYKNGIIKKTEDIELTEDYSHIVKKEDIYLNTDEKFLVEKIIETKDKKMMQEVARAVKSGFSKKDIDALHDKYVKYRAKRIRNVLGAKNTKEKTENHVLPRLNKNNTRTSLFFQKKVKTKDK